MKEIQSTQIENSDGTLTMAFEGRVHVFAHKQDAEWVHEQLCRAHRKGVEDAQSRMLNALGLKLWAGQVSGKLGQF